MDRKVTSHLTSTTVQFPNLNSMIGLRIGVDDSNDLKVRNTSLNEGKTHYESLSYCR